MLLSNIEFDNTFTHSNIKITKLNLKRLVLICYDANLQEGKNKC